MLDAIKKNCCDYKCALPFILLMATSFFLPTAGHRIVFYALVPFLGYFIYQQRDHLKETLNTYSFKFLVVYLGYFLLSLLWSEPAPLEDVVRIWRDMTCILVFTLSLSLFLQKPPSMNVEKAAFWFSGIVLLFAIGLIGYFLMQGLDFETGRLEGVGRYENPIHFAYLLSFAVLILLSFDGMNTRFKQVLRFGIIILCLVCIFLSGTRAVLVGIVGCVILLGLLGRRQLALILSGLCLIAVLASCVIWDFSAGNYLKRADSNRFGIWSEVIQHVEEKPVLGHGIATEPRFYKERESGWKSTHNAFLGHAYTGGTIGLVLYLALLGNMMMQSLRRYYTQKKAHVKPEHLLFTNATILLIGNLVFISLFNFTHFLGGLHIHWLMFWVPFAMAWVLEVEQKKMR